MTAQAREGSLRNVGTKTRTIVTPAKLPDADAVARAGAAARQERSNVDVLLVNPPSPDGGIWIRTQHRVGRRTRENMIWPQVSLAQMAALLQPDYTRRDRRRHRRADELDGVRGSCCASERPKYYLTQVTAPTLTNDMYGAFLAKALGARDHRLRHARHADAARDAAAVSRRSTSSCAASPS